MAEDDMIDPEDLEEELEVGIDDDVDPVEVDPDELDEEDLADEPFVDIDDEFADADSVLDAEEEAEDTDGPVRRAVPTDDDDDDDMLAPDDVEADLDTILKDRLVAVDSSDDDDEDLEETDDRGDSADRLQPKRPDELMCPNCFLLVRKGAPACPIGDDGCPMFPAR